MSARIETTTIQTWPSGISYEFFGDIHGPAAQRQLRKRNYNGADQEPFRPGTADEWRAIIVSTLAERYREREIYCCDSSFVDDLLKNALETSGDLADGFGDDEIANQYADPSDWTLEQCHGYAEDNGIDAPKRAPNPWEMSRDEIVEALAEVSIECRDDETDEVLREALIVNINDETIDGLEAWRDACREYAQDNPAEVFEWWRVSQWLCNRLREIGEVVIDNGYGCWWGRTCTGQSLIMDGTLQRVAAQFVEEPETMPEPVPAP